jgi:type IV pilus assembly protein PilC
MTEFYYEGYLQGSKVKGSIEAVDKLQALKKLKEKGITPTLITEKKKGFDLTLLTSKPSDDDVAFVLMQIYTLLKNGLPITKVLELVSSQTENKTLSSELIKIKSSVESGKSLSDAFKESKVFPQFLSVMLQSAQTGENLEFVFKVSSEFILKISQIKSKVVSALIYPSVIIFFSVISIFIAVKFVVPKITTVLENFGKEPPFITKLMVYFSKILTGVFYLTPVFILGFVFKHKLISKEKYDKFLLSIPIVGKVILYFNLTRFSQVLHMTLQTNTPIQTAVKLSINSLSNEYIKQSLKDLPEKIEKGSSISKALSDVKILPPLFVNLIQTGEASGELESMLQTVSKVYEDLTEKLIQRWTSLIEPFMMLFIGVIVAVIVVSVILPITDISAGKIK